MALQGLNCVWCGAPLQKEGEGYFCKHCGRAYKDDGIEQAYRRLVEGIEAQFGSAISDAQRKEKEERFYALRANLWEKSHASNVDSRAILEICREIKGIYPYDFVACFFEVANGPSVKELVEFLDKTDVKENAVYIDSVLDFLLRSLSQELILPVGYLIERAYKATDLPKFEEYVTLLEKEARLVDAGTYETTIPRDVFIAYASEDIEAVLALVKLLEENEITCFVAMRNLQHGIGAVDNYVRALQTAIENCKTIVFVSSKNSRKIKRDAMRLELPYVKKLDLENAPAGYRLDYSKLPQEYKKPRVEYRLDNEKTAAADSILREFFAGLDYCETPEKVMERVARYLSDGAVAELEMEAQLATAQAVNEGEGTVRADDKWKRKLITIPCKRCGKTFSAENLLEDDEYISCAACGKIYAVADILPTHSEYSAEDGNAEVSKSTVRKEESVAKEQTPKNEDEKPEETKTCNKWVTLALCYFLGNFGVHKFYEGKKKWGLIYLFTFGLFHVGVVVDFVKTIFKPTKYPKVQKKKKGGV